jgi:transposase InsO family protein
MRVRKRKHACCACKSWGESLIKESATRWLWTYNHERPNMALGGITPMQKLMHAN